MNDPSHQSSSASQKQTAVLTDDVVKMLMRELEQTREGEMSCSDSFALLDEYVELVSSEEDAAKLMPLVQAHLDACPDCQDCAQMLLHMLDVEE